MKQVLMSFIFVLTVCFSSQVRAEPIKEFIMACTYGVLAGTLVGAASLAFTEKPGDNFQNVARGASLGLYAGIILGVYVAYILPGASEADDAEAQMSQLQPPQLWLSPVISQAQVEGAMLNYNVYRF